MYGSNVFGTNVYGKMIYELPTLAEVATAVDSIASEILIHKTVYLEEHRIAKKFGLFGTRMFGAPLKDVIVKGVQATDDISVYAELPTLTEVTQATGDIVNIYAETPNLIEDVRAADKIFGLEVEASLEELFSFYDAVRVVRFKPRFSITLKTDGHLQGIIKNEGHLKGRFK